MDIVKQNGWVYYIGDTSEFDDEKVGKWMYFFSDKSFVSGICKNAVDNNIVNEAKHHDKEEGQRAFI